MNVPNLPPRPPKIRSDTNVRSKKVMPNYLKKRQRHQPGQIFVINVWARLLLVGQRRDKRLIMTDSSSNNRRGSIPMRIRGIHREVHRLIMIHIMGMVDLAPGPMVKDMVLLLQVCFFVVVLYMLLQYMF